MSPEKKIAYSIALETKTMEAESITAEPKKVEMQDMEKIY